MNNLINHLNAEIALFQSMRGPFSGCWRHNRPARRQHPTVCAATESATSEHIVKTRNKRNGRRAPCGSDGAGRRRCAGA